MSIGIYTSLILIYEDGSGVVCACVLIQLMWRGCRLLPPLRELTPSIGAPLGLLKSLQIKIKIKINSAV
ncbi:hypothetical protein EXN22_17235 [Pseudomonas tructae]|uniref:Uncharacterized protein n=1 Tax=Pseudomonas tructae TaxID=2518644 RepID=A0A411MKL6_9PSED|nr:hypothetical protein [Pseudomonas tructae]QBF27345.1 hypothetical protein EXN22_17235 [Pseudomonas tructae]